MIEALTVLESPIDVMHPIHKALRAEAAQAEAQVRALKPGESLAPFAQAFARWYKALEYHAVTEDVHMTAALNRPIARTNEAEHQHLTELLADLQTYLQQQADPGTVTSKTRRQVLGKVVALGIAQDDHLEEEEERILPVIRQQMSEEQQRDLACRLLQDCETADACWIMTWLTPYLTPTEQQLLADLAAQTTVE
jgi:hemerythrin-like domain-containing protein